MAGSWQHMTTRRGKLLNNERFCGMIENLGDAYEAAEECYGMVQALANELATGHQPDWTREQWIEWAHGHYRDGIALGGRQRD